MTRIELHHWAHYLDGVIGEVHGHPRFPDGHHVLTSPVVEWGEGFIITRSGTRYELGEPWEPDAPAG